MIIGITGTIGSGKGTVVDYLREQKNFLHYSVSGDILTSILQERGETVDRDGMNRVANELRAANPAGPVGVAYEKYMSEGNGQDIIIEALHSVPEVEYVKSVGGLVLGVNADPDIRYDRISARGSVKDNVTREEFRLQQEREDTGTGDPNKSNLSATFKQSDYRIVNDGTLEQLHQQIDQILNNINHG